MILHYGLVVLCIAGVFGINNSNLREGESCQLPNAKPGKCRRMLDCPQRDPSVNLTPTMRCKSTPRYVRVVCCPPVTAQAMCKSVPIRFENRLKPHIVGKAELAAVGEFPFMGLVIFRDPTKRCGAALITDKLLLTAAHCFRRGDAVEVMLGSNAARDIAAERYGIKSVVTHPDFKWRVKGSSADDIAIVELVEKVDFTNEISPLCLHGSVQDPPTNENLTVVGWGLTDKDTLATTDSLMKGTVRISPQDECRERYRNVRKTNITDSHLCAQGDVDSTGDVYTDACEGDSGGPLVKLVGSKYFLVGIVSTGHGCGVQRYPGVYTRVASYVDWITNEIETKFS